MTKKYLNNTNISLSMAVWLANDEYDHNDDTNVISVTSLIKPLKQIILSGRVEKGTALPDIAGLVKAQSGTAIHYAVEKAWLTNYKTSMEDLGYPDKIINKVRVNPSKDDLSKVDGILPIYVEKRSERDIGGLTVSGKFDLVVDGVLEDIKTTSTYTYIKKSNDRAYQLQGSIYRWLNQDIIKADHMLIQYVFTDWNAGGLKQNPSKYPPNSQMAYTVPLMPLEETNAYVEDRIIQLKALWDVPEENLSPCNSEELWQDDTVWKYYKNPTKTARSTKNFTNAYEANVKLAEDGNTGLVVEVQGAVKACKYCDAFSVCKQKDALLLSGALKA